MRYRTHWHWFLLAIVVFTLPAMADKPEPGRTTPYVPPERCLAVSGEQFLSALSTHERSDVWKPSSNEERSRGPSAAVYPKVAPATVVIRLPDGHGTGFLVSDDGWIVTNHHVAVNAATMTAGPAAGAQAALVHLGRLEEGIMTVDEQAIPALVYKLDLQHDLALLKLTRLPDGVEKLPFVKLANDRPTPGMSCVVIGHPKSGMLWTVRSGEIAALGTWPKDMLAVMMSYLSVAANQKESIAKTLASAPQRKVVVSSCGINPGDSGGPLVNENGELIAVTFAIPKSEKESEVSLDKFSFHVHLDEVRALLAERPEKAPLFIPDVWPQSTASMLVDRDEDGKNDTWTFLMSDGTVTGVMFDADQDSGTEFKAEFNAGTRTRESWDAEFVLHLAGRAFYDKDNDGKMDEILLDFDRDGRADLALRKSGNTWARREVSDQSILDPKLFDDPAIGERVEKINQGKGRLEAGAEPVSAPENGSPPLATPSPPKDSTEKPAPVKSK